MIRDGDGTEFMGGSLLGSPTDGGGGIFPVHATSTFKVRRAGRLVEACGVRGAGRGCEEIESRERTPENGEMSSRSRQPVVASVLRTSFSDSALFHGP
jgi:hypothetical protein